MNKITRLVNLPLLLGSIPGLWLLFTGAVSWWWPVIFYVVFGVIGNGTIAHRYFVHDSFKVPPFMRYIFGWWVVLGAYSPPMVWIIQHRHHHAYSDQEVDIHSPRHGFWQSLAGWRLWDEIHLNKFATRRAIRQLMLDPAVVFSTRYFFPIFLGWVILLGIINWQLLLAGYCVGMTIEFIRIGLINTVCHYPELPGNYVNNPVKDTSANNVLLGWFGGGSGWHNNHHKFPKKLILTQRWWEFDFEGYVGWLFSKITMAGRHRR